MSLMAQRAAALAERFEAMNQQLIETVEGCSDAEWRMTTSREGWPVGVVAHHVAAGHTAIAELIRLAATGQPEPAMTLEMLDQANAAHARQHANCTKVETLELLRRNGAAAVTIVRGLTDEELDRVVSAFRMRTYPSWVPAMSVARTIERFLIDHIREHLGNVLAVIGPAS
jgi:uncharacterized damage-inducible protein DinB